MMYYVSRRLHMLHMSRSTEPLRWAKVASPEALVSRACQACQACPWQAFHQASLASQVEPLEASARFSEIRHRVTMWVTNGVSQWFRPRCHFKKKKHRKTPGKIWGESQIMILWYSISSMISMLCQAFDVTNSSCFITFQKTHHTELGTLANELLEPVSQTDLIAMTFTGLAMVYVDGS